ncbi:hypothetical protein BYT27DRAFT_7199774, partial [Phlegmacium glaucopus]
MSFTLTNSAETSTVLLLSPSKTRHISSVVSPSIKEIWAWTLTSDAIASCSIRDVLQLRENEKDHYDFFWLGRVPCRSVKLVGIVVGVIVYEKRIIYTIDDGTAVIDCSHPQPTQPKVDAKRTLSELSTKPEPPPVLKPIAKVGHFVQVIGKVRVVYNSRQIIVDRIETCRSPNDELVHTRTVRQLHRTSYSLIEPFVIPPRTYQPAFTTPTKNRGMVIQTPSTTRSSPPSSISSSPVKPESPEQIHKQSPPKLRHPSRLHSQDVTSNTFRIYVKHYMDHASIISNIPESEYDCDDAFATSIADMPARPFKLPRFDYTNETPRPKRSRHQLESTPRPRIPQPDFGSSVASSSAYAQHPSSTPDTGPQGFSLSYLRRVPELSLLASRVVQAVTRRRLREERRKLKEAGMLKSKSQASSAILLDKAGPKMKRLFQWAIIQLLKEGCIVLWDGPVRKCPNASVANTTRLWKSVTNPNSTSGDPSTLFGTTTTSHSKNRHQDIDDDGDLSDPSPDEEAYISLTPGFSADYIEAAVKVLSDRQVKMDKPYAGTTVQDILAFMRKDDDRWRYLGDWTVKDALDVLRKEGRVWKTGKDSWDVTV